jgi:antitoxin (DNA-binding transcriptional repressor) of toxin-antitoxin stability system
MTMQHETISATELARNVSMSIDRVRISGQSLYVTKGTQTVAELCPPPKSGFPIDRLAGLLAAIPTLGGDAATMSNDMDTVRNHAKLPENPWD